MCWFFSCAPWLLRPPMLPVLLMWLFFSFSSAVFVHVSHRFTYLLSMIIIYQRSLWWLSVCKTRRSKGLRSKCIARYAFTLSFIYGGHWWCVLKSSVSIYVTERGHIIIITVIYPSFCSFQELWPVLTVIRGNGIDHSVVSCANHLEMCTRTLACDWFDGNKVIMNSINWPNAFNSLITHTQKRSHYKNRNIKKPWAGAVCNIIE